MIFDIPPRPAKKQSNMDTKLLQILNNRERNYPRQLEKQYPRVLKKILANWESPDAEGMFVEYLVSDREDRKGFPAEVASDILYLSMVHARQFGAGVAGDPWAHVSEKFKQEIESHGVAFSVAGLIDSVEMGRHDLVALFLSSGAHIDSCDDRMWTPLMIAAFNGNEKLTRLLVRCGASIHHKDKAGYVPLHWAAFNGFAKVVKLLLTDEANVDARSNFGWTPLLQAATRGHLSVSFMLIEQGADVNASSQDGWTPLMKAAANGHLPEVMLLLNKGANVNAKQSDGSTALDFAVKHKHEGVIAALTA
jgi:ankyrin repeat protein